MVAIGVDTIRFHKSFHPDITRQIILPKMGRDGNGMNWFHGILTFTHKYDPNRFSFQITPSKMMNGNNLVPATPDVIGESINKFEAMTDLDVQDAQLSRLDVAMNMDVERPVKDYFDVMMMKRGYEQLDYEFSRYANTKSKSKTLVMYDKMEEMKKKDKWDGGKTNLMRIEYRMLRNVERCIGIDREMDILKLSHMGEAYGFIGAIQSFEHEVTRMLGLKGCKKGRMIDDVMDVMVLKNVDEMESMLNGMVLDGQDDGSMGMLKKMKTKCMRKEIKDKMRLGCDEMYGKYKLDRMATIDKKDILDGMERAGMKRKKGNGIMLKERIIDILEEDTMHEEIYDNTEKAHFTKRTLQKEHPQD
jgi:hypothetical protein